MEYRKTVGTYFLDNESFMHKMSPLSQTIMGVALQIAATKMCHSKTWYYVSVYMISFAPEHVKTILCLHYEECKATWSKTPDFSVFASRSIVLRMVGIQDFPWACNVFFEIILKNGELIRVMHWKCQKSFYLIWKESGTLTDLHMNNGNWSRSSEILKNYLCFSAFHFLYFYFDLDNIRNANKYMRKNIFL